MAEEFQRRLDTIFGALDQHDPQSSAPSWSISDRVVQNRGQDPTDSESGDEREHQECIQVLCDVEEEEGNGLGRDQLPSSSACKAFEKEEEEDEFDRLACESLQKLRCRPKPALKTQVAERNIYDRMTSKISSPGTPSSPVSPSSRPRSDRKKVRFRVTDEYAEDSPAVTPSAAGTRSHCTTPLQGPSPRVRRKLIDGEPAVPESTLTAASGPSSLLQWQPTMTDTRQQQQPSASAAPALISADHPRSHVPEHVRRPDAFTCYTLDVPVVVGSGNDGQSASSAASAASAAVEYMQAGATAVAQGPASTATGGPEPGAVQFVSRAARDDSGAKDSSAAGHGSAAGWGVAEKRAAAVQASAVDSDMEDAFDGLEAGDGVPGDVVMAASSHTVHATVPMETVAGGPPCFIASGELFAGKGGRRAGRKMRARCTDDD